MAKIGNDATKHQVIVYNDDKSVSIEPVVDITADMIETRSGLYHMAAAEAYVNRVKGGLVYVLNVPVPAAVEAEQLKLLRRSVALKQIFAYDRGKEGLNIMALMPWIICALVVMFR